MEIDRQESYLEVFLGSAGRGVEGGPVAGCTFRKQS